MKFYLDTVSMVEIQEMAGLGLLDGVGMNAYLSPEQGMDFYQGLCEICHHVNGPISVDMLSIEEKAMIKEGKELAKIHENIIVKCPLTPAGLKATKRLTAEGVKVNMSLWFSLSHAFIAAKAGAWCVCPFVPITVTSRKLMKSVGYLMVRRDHTVSIHLTMEG